MADDAAYLRQALPVLVAYTRQVVMAVDVDRLHRAAEEAGHADQAAFLAAMRDFRQAVRGLHVDDGVLP